MDKIEEVCQNQTFWTKLDEIGKKDRIGQDQKLGYTRNNLTLMDRFGPIRQLGQLDYFGHN